MEYEALEFEEEATNYISIGWVCWSSHDRHSHRS